MILFQMIKQQKQTLFIYLYVEKHLLKIIDKSLIIVVILEIIHIDKNLIAFLDYIL